MSLERARLKALITKIANGEEEEEEVKRPLTDAEKGTVRAFFKANPSPSDDKVHELAESMGVSPHSLEEEIYKMVGKTAQKHEHVPDYKYDPEQLRMGIKVEKEHTDDPEKAKELSKDYLSELPDYYTRLDKMEEEGKKQLEQAKKAYLNECAKLAMELTEEGYADEMMKMAGYSQEEIDQLRTIYREARALRKKMEKPLEPLEDFMEGSDGPKYHPPINPLGLGEARRWPMPIRPGDKKDIKPYKTLLDKEMAVHKGKDREDIAAAVRYIRETSFMNNPKAEN